MNKEDQKTTAGSTQQTQNETPIITDAHINNIAIRVPTFWRAEPALWFAQLDAQFDTARVTSDRTKYNTIVGSIDSAILQHVSDIVLNPPVTDKYEMIKKRLIDNFSDSDTKRLKRLLSELELGDKRPSQLLREMQSLAVNLDKEIIQQLWLQRIPTSTQAI